MGRNVKAGEQFFECKDIGPEPPLNKEGFWKKHVEKDKYSKERKPARR